MTIANRMIASINLENNLTKYQNLVYEIKNKTAIVYSILFFLAINYQ